MSVLIKGWKIPSCCNDCPFNFGFDCYITKSYIGRVFEYHERLGDCPLVEVPPHGRLIDADALADVSAKRLGIINIGHIDDAPTIIPAEEEKDENSGDRI